VPTVGRSRTITWYPESPTIDAAVTHSPPFPPYSHRHGHHHAGDARHVGQHGRKGDHDGHNLVEDQRQATRLPLQTRGNSGHQIGGRAAVAAAHAIARDQHLHAAAATPLPTVSTTGGSVGAAASVGGRRRSGGRRHEGHILRA
jgi:hypothetical protein